ncbi:MAG: hypothetical protein AAFX99_12075 [Myxococcota bacterium]
MHPLAYLLTPTVALHILLTLLLVRTLVLCTFRLKQHLLAPLMLQPLALLVSTTAIAIGLVVTWLYGVHSWLMGVGVAVLVQGVVLAMLAMLGRRHWLRQATLEASGLITVHQRLPLYRAYIRAFPNDLGPLVSELTEQPILRLLRDLDREGQTTGGASLGDWVVEHLQGANPALINRAAALGFPGLTPIDDLNLPRDAEQQAWTAILERDPAAPRVGRALRAILEEALARQDKRLGLVIHLPQPCHAAVRLALESVERHLKHLGQQLMLDVIAVYNPSRLDDAILFHLDLEVTDFTLVEPPSELEQGVVPRPVAMEHDENRRTLFPIVRLRAALKRRGRRESDPIEATSQPGLDRVNARLASSQTYLAKHAGASLAEGLQHGLGLVFEPQAEEAFEPFDITRVVFAQEQG